MNIGKLHQFKEYFWLLYPSKEIATTAPVASEAYTAYGRLRIDWSKHYKCNISYISPNSIFVLLEKDGEFIKILSTNGELGWFYLADWCKDDIEEVKTE